MESMAPLQQFPLRPVTPLQQFPSRPVTPPTPLARHGALASGSFSLQRSNAFRTGFFLKRIVRSTSVDALALLQLHPLW